MNIVRIIGGLGNQMFQYALAISLSERFPSQDVKIDITSFKGYGLHNGYEIERIFSSAKLSHASFKDILKIGYPYPNNLFRRIFKHVLPARKSMVVENKYWAYEKDILLDCSDKYLDGYWQSEDYFKHAEDRIREVFEFPEIHDDVNNKFINSIEGLVSASIHVRRGDYVGHRLLGGICTEEYFKSAINSLRKDKSIDCWVIFSDDADWARINISKLLPDSNVLFVDWNEGEYSYRDMQLMSLCNHNIISNSSFSWWGAWLNNHKDKIVIAPSRWLNLPLARSVTPSAWRTI